MDKEALDIQKEIEKYFTESTGFGRDKIKNFMDIVNKALKQKEERIEQLEKENKKIFNDWLEACDKYGKVSLEQQKNKEQLERATEIIKELLDTQSCLDPYRDIFKDRIIKAEQFLKEIEK